MIHRFHKIFVILVVFIPLQINAQHHRFRHLSVDDGLSHNGVYCFAQDEKGFIWVGTESGLNRYDGTSIKVYQHEEKNIHSISSDDINCLLAYKDQLYIGTHTGGLNRFDLKKNKIYRYETNTKGNGKINSDYIQSLQISPDKKILIGTYDGGINILDPETEKITYLTNDSHHPKVLASNYIKSMTFDQQNNLWISHPRTGVSCYSFKTKKWKLFTDATTNIGKLNNLATRQVFCDSKNRIWISTWSGGINIYDIEKSKMYSNATTKADVYFKPFMTSDSNAVNRHKNDPAGKKYEKLYHLRMVFGFSEDAFGNIWAVTVENGLYVFNPENEKLRQFKNNPLDASSICDNNLLSLFIDKSGLVWTGSLSAGVNIFNPYTDRFGYYKADPDYEFGLPNNHIWAIHTGKKSGKLFISLTGYVYEFIPGENKFINYIVDKNGKSLLHNQSICQAIHEDVLGNLWISINGSGVYKYNKLQKIITNYNDKPNEGGLLHHTINTFAEDSRGNVWLGMSMFGLNKYVPSENKFYPYYHDRGEKGNLSGHIIHKIVVDKNDCLWIATDSGLNVLNTKTNEINYYYEQNSSLNSNSIYSLYNDNNKFIYIGTANGLCRYSFNTGKIEDLTAKYKFADKGVGGITVDQRGNLWLQPVKGILKVDVKTFKQKLFDFSDGLQSNEFPTNIIQTLSTGEIIFGGSKGLNVFHPDAIITNKTKPGISITNFLLRNVPQFFDTDISYLDEVTLDYDHYFFTVELAALDFTNLTKNKYRYKLEGFKDEWVELGNNHQITFVNLEPGEYTLYISGCNNDGVWSEIPAKLKIIITPPFWKTTWFYFLCGITIVISIYGYIKYREKKLQKEKRVLEEKVDKRTHELREEKEKVEEAHKEIRDSINYAKRLQEAILPPPKLMDEFIPENYILFKPKDIVAGDFYWAEKTDDYFFIAAADCTGHGVPGAMVSVVCSNALNRSVKEFGITETGKILDKTTDLVLETFAKSDQDVKDGMDISLIAIAYRAGTCGESEKTIVKITWSGANNPLWYIENGDLKEIKADKQPIGKSDNRKPFTTHTLPLSLSSLILFTDGYADQFGGEKGKKFKYKPMMELISSVSSLSMNEQKTILENNLEEWKGSLEQNDDICIIGISI